MTWARCKPAIEHVNTQQPPRDNYASRVAAETLEALLTLSEFENAPITSRAACDSVSRRTETVLEALRFLEAEGWIRVTGQGWVLRRKRFSGYPGPSYDERARAQIEAWKAGEPI